MDDILRLSNEDLKDIGVIQKHRKLIIEEAEKMKTKVTSGHGIEDAHVVSLSATGLTAASTSREAVAGQSTVSGEGKYLRSQEDGTWAPSPRVGVSLPGTNTHNYWKNQEGNDEEIEDVNHKNERPKMRNTNQSHHSESQEQNMEEKMRRLEKDIVNLRQENERLTNRQLQEYLSKLASDGYLPPENLDLVLHAGNCWLIASLCIF